MITSMPSAAAAGRERGDHVVGLDAGDLQRGDVQRVDHLVDQRDLRHEEVGRLLAGALVVGVELVAEVRPGLVEHDRDAVGLLVAEHLHEHRREAEDRVRDRALGRRQVGRERVEGAVRERQAVDQEERRHHRRSYAGTPSRRGFEV